MKAPTSLVGQALFSLMPGSLESRGRAGQVGDDLTTTAKASVPALRQTLLTATRDTVADAAGTLKLVTDPVGSVNEMVDGGNPAGRVQRDARDSIQATADAAGAERRQVLQGLSPEAKALDDETRRTYEDDGFLAGVGHQLANPSSIARMAVESAPSTALAMLAGRFGARGVAAATVPMGAGEAMVGARDAINALPEEKLREVPEYTAALEAGATPAQALQQLIDQAERVAGMVGAGAGTIPTAPGLNPVEHALARRAATGEAAGLAQGLAASRAGQAVREAVGEVPEEAGNQLGSNLGQRAAGVDADVMDGVAQAAGGALLTGSAMGAVMPTARAADAERGSQADLFGGPPAAAGPTPAPARHESRAAGAVRHAAQNAAAVGRAAGVIERAAQLAPAFPNAQPGSLADAANAIPAAGPIQAAGQDAATPTPRMDEAPGVPATMTNAMRARLDDLGYTPDQVRSMTPAAAWDVISAAPANQSATEPVTMQDAVPAPAGDQMPQGEPAMVNGARPGSLADAASALDTPASVRLPASPEPARAPTSLEPVAPALGDTEAQAGQGVPAMITRDMRERLASAGYSPDQVRTMSPAAAWDALGPAASGGDRAQPAGAAAQPEPRADSARTLPPMLRWQLDHAGYTPAQIDTFTTEAAWEALVNRDTPDRAQGAGEAANTSIDAAARAAAASPHNPRAEPTPAQRDAGNYAMGHVRLHGLDVSIETPAGSRRRPEHAPLQHHYGYIRGTRGRDKDHVDVFLGPRADDAAAPVFVVDQTDRTGAFDEHKVLMGFNDEAEASAAYRSNYPQDWNGLGAITRMEPDQFKAWVRDEAATRRPAAGRGTAEPSLQDIVRQLEQQHGQVSRLVATTTRNWDSSKLPPISVVRSVDELPLEARRDPRAHRAKGLFHEGRIWIISNTMDRRNVARDTQQVLLHELVGHYGVDSIIDDFLPGGWKTLEADILRMRDNPALHKDLRGVMDAVTRRYQKPDGSLQDSREFAREVVAVAAERKLRNSLTGRIVAAVKRFLRQHFPSMRVTDGDVRALLAASNTWLRTPAKAQRTSTEAAPAFDLAAAAGVTSNAEIEQAQKAWLAQGADSPWFKRWFGDSKVVDADGQPLVMYHGTSRSGFDQFDTVASNYGLMGKGAYFTADPAMASSYTGKGRGETPGVYSVYLSIKNPVDMDATADPRAWQATFEGVEDFHEGGDTNESWYRAAEDMLADQMLPAWEGAEVMQEGLLRMGFDGITHLGGGRVDRDGVRHRVYIAFSPEQIKSATGNRGTFDGADPSIAFSLAEPVDSPAFQSWFQDSKVLDAKGKPRTVFHGTAAEFEAFDPTLLGDSTAHMTAPLGFYFAEDRAKAERYAQNASRGVPADERLIEAYLSIQNPQEMTLDAFMAVDNTDEARALRTWLEQRGHDGIHLKDIGQWIAFRPEQVKATTNRGTFDPADPRMDFSLAEPTNTFGHLSDDQRQALGKIGAFAPGESFGAKVRRMSTQWQQKLIQGVFDQFRPLKDLDATAYMQARLSKGTDGALEAAFRYGPPRLVDGALDVKADGQGFQGVLADLAGEHDLFMAWVAGNRASRLASEGRERLFDADEITALQRLNTGRMPDGRDRKTTYARALQAFNRYQSAVLDIATEAGLINDESRKQWQHEFYVPFYRVMEGDATVGPGDIGGLVGQRAFKRLKGGEEPLGDLLANTLTNWSHLLSASMKNLAGQKALRAAADLGVADRVPEPERGSVRVMVNGRPRHYVVGDPLVLDALTMLHHPGWNNPAMKAMQWFKRALTTGVTTSPTFRIRNLIRDTVSAIGSNEVSYNPLRNLIDGWKGTQKASETYQRLLGGGGAIRFGTLLDGDQAANAKRLIATGVASHQILDAEQKVKNAFASAWDWYQYIGDRAEAVNRAAIYERARADGKSHLEASFAARDLLDFTMGGKWAAVRFLTQIVPFMNARLQGMYKLGRSAQQDPRRFASVAGAVALASVLLHLANQDDDEYRALPDWVRDTYWWVRLPGTEHALYIPKPFELGALGSVAERAVELITGGNDYTGRDFMKTVGGIVADQLSMNPVPQAVKPFMEAAFNRDSFRDRDIDSMSQERLPAGDRYTAQTSAAAVGLGQAIGYSPQRLEHMVRGYFGWLGAQALNVSDLLLRPAMDLPSNPRNDLSRVENWIVVGDLVKPTAASGGDKYLTRFYDMQRRVDEVYAAYSEARKAGDLVRMRELAGDRRLQLRRVYNGTRNQITRLNQRIRRITNDRRMTPAEKRDLLDGLNSMRNRIAERADIWARALPR